MRNSFLGFALASFVVVPVIAHAGGPNAGPTAAPSSSVTPAPGVPVHINAAPLSYSVAQLGSAGAQLLARFGPPRTGPNLTNTPTSSINPRIASSGNDVYLVWEDTATGGGDIYFSFSHDGGASFFAPRNLSNTPAKSSQPVIAVAGRSIVVAWLETQGNFVTVMGTSSTDAENAFAPAALLSQSEVRARDLSVGAADGWLAATWIDSAINDNVARGESVAYRALLPPTPPVVLARATEIGRLYRPRIARASSITFATWGAENDAMLAFGNNQTFSVNTTAKFGRSQVAIEWNPIVLGAGANALFAYETRSGASHALEVHASNRGYAGLLVPSTETSGRMGGSITYPAGNGGLTTDMTGDFAFTPDAHVHGAAIVRNVDKTTTLVVSDANLSQRTTENASYIPSSALQRVRVAANATSRFVAIEGLIGSEPANLHILRAHGPQLALWSLGPALGPTANRTNLVVAATNRGAALAWQAGPPGAEDIYFATLANE